MNCRLGRRSDCCLKLMDNWNTLLRDTIGLLCREATHKTLNKSLQDPAGRRWVSKHVWKTNLSMSLIYEMADTNPNLPLCTARRFEDLTVYQTHRNTISNILQAYCHNSTSRYLWIRTEYSAENSCLDLNTVFTDMRQIKMSSTSKNTTLVSCASINSNNHSSFIHDIPSTDSNSHDITGIEGLYWTFKLWVGLLDMQFQCRAPIWLMASHESPHLVDRKKGCAPICSPTLQHRPFAARELYLSMTQCTHLQMHLRCKSRGEKQSCSTAMGTKVPIANCVAADEGTSCSRPNKRVPMLRRHVNARMFRDKLFSGACLRHAPENNLQPEDNTPFQPWAGFARNDSIGHDMTLLHNLCRRAVASEIICSNCKQVLSAKIDILVSLGHEDEGRGGKVGGVWRESEKRSFY